MITDQDVKKLKTVFLTKDQFKTLDKRVSDLEVDFAIQKKNLEDVKEDLSYVKETVQAIMVGVDKLLGSFDFLKTEYNAMGSQVSRHDKWIKTLAEKTGTKLK